MVALGLVIIWIMYVRLGYCWGYITVMSGLAIILDTGYILRKSNSFAGSAASVEVPYALYCMSLKFVMLHYDRMAYSKTSLSQHYRLVIYTENRSVVVIPE